MEKSSPETTTVPIEDRGRGMWASAAGTWALRTVLVASALLALRTAGLLHREAVQRGREEFSLMEAFTSGGALAAAGLLVVSALLFTFACRLPLRGGISWAPLLLALVPLVLAAHWPLFAWFADELRDLRWAQPFYFWNEEPMRWAMLALVGVALGTSIGRSVDRPRRGGG